MNIDIAGMAKTEIFGFILLFIVFVWLVTLSALSRVRGDQWLRKALTSMNDALLITDKRGRIIHLNEIAEKLTGWNADDAHGKATSDILRLVDHDSREPVSDSVAQALKTGKTERLAKNTVLIARDGTERPVDSNTAPILGMRGNIRGAVLIFRDITARYAAEQKLLESEERLRAVTNEARIGLIMINRDRRYVYANSFYLKMLNIREPSVTGRHIRDVLPLLYEQQISYRLDRAFAGERLSYELKGISQKEYGLNRIYSVTYEPQKRHNLVMHVVIVILDITDIRRSDPQSGATGTV